MLALIKLIPLKDWIYTAIIIVLAFFLWRVYHAGEAKIEASDAKFAAAQVIKNQEVELRVKSGIADAVAKFQATPPPPPPAAQPSVVCYAPSSSKVPNRGLSASGGDGTGGTISFSTAKADEGFDPAPAISADGQAADAEIIRLKSKVTLLQDTLKTYQVNGLIAK
jgi:hypothetical protein